MALLTLYPVNFFRVFCLTLAGLLAIAMLAACGSEPEPPSAPPDASASAGNTGSQSVTEATQVPAPAIAPAVESAPPQPAPEPTLAPASTPLVVVPSLTRRPLATPAVEPTSPNNASQVTDTTSPDTAAGTMLHVGPGATWGDVYDSLSEAEQSCILGETGEERLDQMRERPFSLQGVDQESVALIDCISDDTARELFIADMAAQSGGLTEEQKGCVRTLLTNFSPSQLAAASTGEPTPEDAMLLLSFGLGLVGCLPELAAQPPGGPPADAGGDGPGQMAPSPSQLWSFTTGGPVLIAPAVADGVVYAGSDDHSLYALTADSGELLGSFATGGVIRSTPTIVDGIVYFGSNDNHIYALHAGTGQQMWKYDTGEWVQYSPTVGGGKVYFGAPADGNRRVHAVGAATGEVAWIAENPFPIGANHTPTYIGNKVYAQGAEYGEFYALNAATGEVAWQTEVGGYVESAPTVIDGVVYLTVINQAYALNEATGDVIWSFNTEEFPARDFPALVVDGVYYLAPSDKVYALDASTGEELWRYETSMLSTAPVVAYGVLYGASEDEGQIFALDAATGEELWSETMGDFTINALTAADGTLYGELSNGQLVAADAANGIPVWSFEKGGFSDVRGYTVLDGIVYSAGPNNSVYAHLAP